MKTYDAMAEWDFGIPEQKICQAFLAGYIDASL